MHRIVRFQNEPNYLDLGILVCWFEHASISFSLQNSIFQVSDISHNLALKVHSRLPFV